MVPVAHLPVKGEFPSPAADKRVATYVYLVFFSTEDGSIHSGLPTLYHNCQRVASSRDRKRTHNTKLLANPKPATSAVAVSSAPSVMPDPPARYCHAVVATNPASDIATKV